MAAVLIPIRGNGKCPKRSAKIRYGIKKCNMHECDGDEVRIAKQDFAAGLIDRYKGKYYEFEALRTGVA